MHPFESMARVDYVNRKKYMKHCGNYDREWEKEKDTHTYERASEGTHHTQAHTRQKCKRLWERKSEMNVTD